jgi:hypothetical protein
MPLSGRRFHRQQRPRATTSRTFLRQHLRYRPGCLCLTAVLAFTTACTDGPTEAGLRGATSTPPASPSISASGEDVLDCARLVVSRTPNSAVITASVLTPSGCSGVLRLAVDTSVAYDPGTALLRVPLVLINAGADTLRDPTTARWLGDSSTIVASGGLTLTQAVSPTNADSVVSDPASAWWKFDTTLAVVNSQPELAPGTSSRRVWLHFTLDTSVTEFATTLLVTARLKRDVYSQPPAFVPSWIYSTLIGGDASPEGWMASDILLVAFDGTASSAQRRSAIAAISGQIVGGTPALPNGDGLYYVKVPSGSTPAALLAAADTLEAQPGVEAAMPAYVYADDGADYRRPSDGPAVGTWELSPATATGANWALERINAPMAWGCAIGSTSTSVAVMDVGFPVVEDLQPNVGSTTGYLPGWDHGINVASILAARGDNQLGMVGVMWNAKLRYYERREESTTGFLRRFDTDYVRLAQALRSDARIINISGRHASYPTSFADTAAMRRRNDRSTAFLAALIRGFRTINDKPLIIVSAGNAGNSPLTGGDAAWNVFPSLVSLFPDQVLAVAATTPADTLEQLSNRGTLVNIAAPGDQVMALTGEGVVSAISRTSAATPLVSGAAGLLFSFDTTLTAAQVRQLLIDGAVAGGRQAPDRLTSGTIPIVNAYESLKLAARSPSAPLCGNHAWITDAGQVKVERGSMLQPNDQVVGQIDMPGDFLYVLHGGRRLLFAAESDDGLHAFDYVPYGPWSPTQEDPWDLPEWYGNVYGRVTPWQMSHDKDYGVNLQEDGSSYQVRLTRYEGWGEWQQGEAVAEWQIGTVPRTTFDQGSTTHEGYRRLQLTITPNDNGGTDTVLTNPSSPYGPAGTQTLVNSIDWSEWEVAIAPPGDLVYVGLTRRTGQLQRQSEWGACEMSIGSFQGMPIEQCKDWWYVPQVTGVDYYTVPMSATAATTAGTALNWAALNKPGYSLRSLSVSEDGRELTIATGQEIWSSTEYNPLWSNCGIQWVAAPAGTLNRSITNGHACEYQHVGIVSPSRTAGPPVGPMLSRSGASVRSARPVMGRRNRKEPPSFADFLERVRQEAGR